MKRITSYFDSTSKKAKPNLPLEADHNAFDGTSTGKAAFFYLQKPEAELSESIQSQVIV